MIGSGIFAHYSLNQSTRVPTSNLLFRLGHVYLSFIQHGPHCQTIMFLNPNIERLYIVQDAVLRMNVHYVSKPEYRKIVSYVEDGTAYGHTVFLNTNTEIRQTKYW